MLSKKSAPISFKLWSDEYLLSSWILVARRPTGVNPTDPTIRIKRRAQTTTMETKSSRLCFLLTLCFSSCVHKFINPANRDNGYDTWIFYNIDSLLNLILVQKSTCQRFAVDTYSFGEPSACFTVFDHPWKFGTSSSWSWTSQRDLEIILNIGKETFRYPSTDIGALYSDRYICSFWLII